jgi:hypothetical protein
MEFGGKSIALNNNPATLRLDRQVNAKILFGNLFLSCKITYRATTATMEPLAKW